MASLQSPIAGLGAKAPDFDLPGTDGARHNLASSRGGNGLLVMFICNHCPYVKAVRERIVRDCMELSGHGIGSIAIMANDPAEYPEDSFENMKRVAAEFGYPFPYVLDKTQQAARAFGAVCTPDFFGYNAALELQYRGRLDGVQARTGPGRPSRALRRNGADCPDGPRPLQPDAFHRLLDQMDA